MVSRARAARRSRLHRAALRNHPTESGWRSLLRSSFSPLAVDQPKYLGAGAVERVRINVDVIDAVCQRSQAESIRQPVRKIVRLQLQAQPRREEVEIKRGVAQMHDAVAKFFQRPRCEPERQRDLHAFAKVKALQSRLL